MPIDILALVQQLNSTDENHQIEAKRGSSVDKSFFETVCSFSNEPDLGGGHILLGVVKDEDALFPFYRIVGVDDPDALSQDIASQCASRFNIRIRPRVETHTIKGKTVIGVFVPEVSSSEKPVFFSKSKLPEGAFRRIGSTDQACTDDDMVVFYGERRAESYDAVIVPESGLGDIDNDAISFYRKLRERVNPNAEELQWTNEELLTSLSAIKSVDDVWKPTVTGILLFGTRQALRRLFPMMRVDYIRVQGKEWVENPDERFVTTDMRGPLLQLVQRVQDTIADDLPKGFILPEGKVQAETPSLSTRVLREAIVNALMHRSYKTHSAVQIIRYSNRLEILNPGYSLKSEERLGEPGSENRNPHLAAVFHETNMAETKGSGIRIMRRLMEEANFVPPTFESDRRGNRFVARLLLQHFLNPEDLTWLAEFEAFNLNEFQKKGLIFLRETGAIDNRSFRQLNGIDTYSASKDLRAMRACEILDMRGQSSATYYVPGPVYHHILADSTPKPPIQGGRTPILGTGTPIQGGGTPIQGGRVKHQIPVDEELFAKLDSETILNLNEIRNSKRSNSRLLKSVILALCKVRPLASAQLGGILNRGAPMLIARYLSPMVADGLLRYSIPENIFNPKQAYITSEEN